MNRSGLNAEHLCSPNKCSAFAPKNILVTQAGNSFTQRSTSTQELMNESSIGTRRFRIIRQIFEGLRKSKYQLGIHGPLFRVSSMFERFPKSGLSGDCSWNAENVPINDALWETNYRSLSETCDNRDGI